MIQLPFKLYVKRQDQRNNFYIVPDDFLCCTNCHNRLSEMLFYTSSWFKGYNYATLCFRTECLKSVKKYVPNYVGHLNIPMHIAATKPSNSKLEIPTPPTMIATKFTVFDAGLDVKMAGLDTNNCEITGTSKLEYTKDKDGVICSNATKQNDYGKSLAQLELKDNELKQILADKEVDEFFDTLGDPLIEHKKQEVLE